jgi:hypothetical protein
MRGLKFFGIICLAFLGLGFLIGLIVFLTIPEALAGVVIMLILTALCVWGVVKLAKSLKKSIPAKVEGTNVLSNVAAQRDGVLNHKGLRPNNQFMPNQKQGEKKTSSIFDIFHISAMKKEIEAVKMTDNEFDGSYYTTVVNIGNIPIRIKYESSGEAERNVDVQKIMAHKYGGLYIRGFCHLRNEFRTFALDDRMVSVWSNGKEIQRDKIIYEIIKDSPYLHEHGLIGLNFCFTGTLYSMRRKQAQEKIEELGGSLSGGIGDGTHFLVLGGKKQSGSNKIEDAMEYGVPVISEEKFLEFLEHPEIAQAEKTTERDPRNFTPIVSFSLEGTTFHGSGYKESESEPPKPPEEYRPTAADLAAEALKD